MKRVLIILIFLSLKISFAFGQFKITYQEVKLVDESILKVVVFTQNLGRTSEFWAIYGSTPFEQDEELLNFYIKYEFIPTGRLVRTIASSITVKTIFGTYIPMDMPTYRFPSTGIDRGQEWQILFTGIPQEAANLKINVLGSTLLFGDMPKAEIAKKRRKEKVDKLLSKGEQLFNDKKWKESIIKYTEAITLDRTKMEVYSKKVAIAFFELGEIDYANKNYESLIENYNLALNADREIHEKLKSHLAESYFQVAEKCYDSADFNKASTYYKNAVATDEAIEVKVSQRFKQIQKNTRLSGLYSIIPGVGQLANRENKKALIHFSVFSFSSILGIAIKKQADGIYEDYKKSTDSFEAQSLYQNADKNLNKSRLFFVISAATVLWSMYDSYISTEKYNELFIVGNNKHKLEVFSDINHKGKLLTIAIHF